MGGAWSCGQRLGRKTWRLILNHVGPSLAVLRREGQEMTSQVGIFPPPRSFFTLTSSVCDFGAPTQIFQIPLKRVLEFCVIMSTSLSLTFKSHTRKRWRNKGTLYITTQQCVIWKCVLVKGARHTSANVLISLSLSTHTHTQSSLIWKAR